MGIFAGGLRAKHRRNAPWRDTENDRSLGPVSTTWLAVTIPQRGLGLVARAGGHGAMALCFDEKPSDAAGSGTDSGAHVR
ncbi:hypothetical protein VDGL01_08118 [Verticillium dahliae]